jgi:hypothetical protein
MQALGTSINNLRENLRANAALSEVDKLAILRNVFLASDMEGEVAADDERLTWDFMETTGGNIYLVTDNEADFQFMISHMNPDIRLPLDHVFPEGDRAGDKNTGFDFAQNLNREKTLAGVGVATNNGGGALFIITKDLMDKYPTIREHIEHGMDWLGERLEGVLTDADYLDLIEKVKIDKV